MEKNISVEKWARERGADTLALCEALIRHPITSQADADLVSEGLRYAHDMENTIKAKQEEILKPLRETEAKIRALFRPALRTLEATKTQAKAAISAYLVAAADQNRRAMLAVTEAARAGDHAAAQEKAAELVPIAEIPGLTIGEKWISRIVDPSLVPRDWCVPDERRIAAHAAACKDNAPEPIPGVVFERAARITVKGVVHRG